MTAFSNRTLDRSLPIGPDSSNRFEIGHEVEARFRRAGYLALRDVACDVRAGTVRLQGHLPTYYLKQVAQQVAGEVEGVLRGPQSDRGHHDGGLCSQGE